MLTEILFFLFIVLLFIAGFITGLVFEHTRIMRRLKEVAEEFKPMCGNCKEFNGTWCTKFWNNLDECYLDRERDNVKPEDDACEDWEFDPDCEDFQ